MRLRFRFTKLGKVRWTSHRDLARMWERSFRRVQLPLAYSQGFSPRPKVSFGLALPTGAESVAEYLDVELAAGAPAVPDAALPGRLTAALPLGIDVTAMAVVEDRADSLQESVTSCTWVVDVVDADHIELQSRVERALAADRLVIARVRKGKTSEDDVRPGILSCRVDGDRLTCDLAAQPRTLRPSELLLALGPDVEAASVCRTHQWIPCDGALREIIPLDATDAPHALEARAS